MGDSRWSRAAKALIRTFIGCQATRVAERELSTNLKAHGATTTVPSDPVGWPGRRWQAGTISLSVGVVTLRLWAACLSCGGHYSARVIALIDYGSGNLRSVHKALLKVGAEVRIARRPEEMADARAVGAARRRRV